MSSRVYMLLDIRESRYEDALRVLQGIGGVIMTDTLEGHPNVMVIVEAPDRQRLVELIMPVLGSVDHVTEDVHLLVSQGDRPPIRFLNTAEQKSYAEHTVY